ncbi:MAG TPA: hypothetical protein VGM37_14600 [Armatimonadota bacterium]|jgi:hypothetical protein
MSKAPEIVDELPEEMHPDALAVKLGCGKYLLFPPDRWTPEDEKMLNQAVNEAAWLRDLGRTAGDQ